MGAAGSLAKKIESWAIGGGAKSMRSIRGLNAAPVQGWLGQIDAMRELVTISDQIDELESLEMDVEIYRAALPLWAEAVMMPDIQWNATASGDGHRLVDVNAIALLTSFDHVYTYGLIARQPRSQMNEPRALLYQEDRAADARAALDEITQFLTELNSQPELKAYVLKLIAAIRQAFDEHDVLGDVNLLDQIMVLIGYLNAMAESFEEEDDSTRGKFREWISRILPVTKRTAVAVERGAAFVAAIHEITS